MLISFNTESVSKSSRSLMLKAVMPLLSGENGEELAEAIKEKNPDKVRKVMARISDTLQAKYSSKSNSEDVKECSPIQASDYPTIDKELTQVGKIVREEVNAEVNVDYVEEKAGRILTDLLSLLMRGLQKQDTNVILDWQNLLSNYISSQKGKKYQDSDVNYINIAEVPHGRSIMQLLCGGIAKVELDRGVQVTIEVNCLKESDTKRWYVLEATVYTDSKEKITIATKGTPSSCCISAVRIAQELFA